MKAEERKILESINRGEVSNFTKEILKIPSVTGFEGDLASYLASYMRDAGLEVETQEVETGRPNVIGRLRGDGSGYSLMLNGHIDTVPVCRGWSVDPYGGLAKDGYLYGQGAMDMKGGLAALIMAACAMRKAGVQLRGDLIVAAVSGHMQQGKGSEALMRKGPRPDFVVIGEPTDLKTCIAQRGWVYLDVTTQGKMAHTAYADMGLNAVVKAAKLILAFQKMQFKPVRASPEVKQLLKGPVCYLNIGVVHGGYEPNMIPDVCSFSVDIRPLPGKSANQVIQEVRAFVSGLQRRDVELKARVDFRAGTTPREPFITPSSHRLVKAVNAAYKARATGRRPQLAGFPWWTDAGIICTVHKIPTVAWGPGGPPFYTSDERISERDLVLSAETFASIASEFCLRSREEFDRVYGDNAG